MSYSLFLDDVRKPEQVTWVKLPKVKWTIARNFKEFTHTIKTKGLPDRIAFDHDLAFDYNLDNSSWSPPPNREPTGYDCAMWLIKYIDKSGTSFPEYYIHSMNPIGAENIDSLIKSYKKSIKTNNI